MITLTKEQLSEVMYKHAEKENDLHDLLEIVLGLSTPGSMFCEFLLPTSYTKEKIMDHQIFC